MLDNEASLQQEALGIVGVNLVHGAFFHTCDPQQLLARLLDGLSTQRIEIDVADFSGEAFRTIDNRVLSLKLVQLGLTGAAMFAANGTVLQPSSVLRKRPLVIERGRFRPVTHVNLDMLNAAKSCLAGSTDSDPEEILPIMEITMRNLIADGALCLEDFVSRAEVLATTGHVVMISDYFEYHRLAAYLYSCTRKPIGIAMGLSALEGLFDERYYKELDGGLLESFGRLFKNKLQLLIYPMKDPDGTVRGLKDIRIAEDMRPLFEHLWARNCIRPLENINESYLDIHSPEVLAMIARNDSRWPTMVPVPVANAIRERGLFGYAGG